jgi:hypothetical protein
MTNYIFWLLALGSIISAYGNLVANFETEYIKYPLTQLSPSLKAKPCHSWNAYIRKDMTFRTNTTFQSIDPKRPVAFIKCEDAGVNQKMMPIAVQLSTDRRPATNANYLGSSTALELNFFEPTQ